MKTASKITLILILSTALACSPDNINIDDDTSIQILTSHIWIKDKVSVNNVPTTLSFCAAEDYYIFNADGTSESYMFFNAGNDTDCAQFGPGEFASYTYDTSENRIHIVTDDYDRTLVEVEITSSSLKFSIDSDDNGTYETTEEYKN